MNDLPEHGVRQRRNVDQRFKYKQSLGRSIEQRPMMINQRNRIGNFELDTVVGPRGHSKAALLSRFWISSISNRSTNVIMVMRTVLLSK